MRVLGLDVGNSKIKLCYLESDGVLDEESVRWRSVLLPLGTGGRYDFEVGVPREVRLSGKLFGFDPDALNAVVCCSSHAYSYPLLHESVSNLGSILTHTFGAIPSYMVAVDGTLTPARKIQGLDPEALSAHVLTNYYGSALLGSRIVDKGIGIDIGTTSTDVIPIVEGRVDPVGLAKPSEYLRFRYQHNRLGWYGVTWTPLTMIASEVMTPHGTYQVVARDHRSDIIFALDDKMNLELLHQHAYYQPPDRQRALSDLCALVGLDRRLLKEPEILAVREFLFERLVDKVAGLVLAVT
ncbi:MAG: hydantoinase/oxoprolinase family protein, partial [Candidatus Sulfomarinibacteraceae bacterium]